MEEDADTKLATGNLSELQIWILKHLDEQHAKNQELMQKLMTLQEMPLTSVWDTIGTPLSEDVSEIVAIGVRRIADAFFNGKAYAVLPSDWSMSYSDFSDTLTIKTPDNTYRLHRNEF